MNWEFVISIWIVVIVMTIAAYLFALVAEALDSPFIAIVLMVFCISLIAGALVK